jgi:dTDP-4-amino-4,6-dideoxygalactose transaminase
MINFIPLASPQILEQDILAVNEVLNSGMLVQGKKVEELEQKIANYIGVKEVIAVSNGTASLHLSLIALGVKAGDEVIVPAFSYVATANVVELIGATSIFVDINIKTFNIDVAQIESKITSKTKAIIPVHEFGLACDISELKKLANRYSIPIIEDAACALGAQENGKYTGSFGNLGSFSLHPRKAITSGEGGLIATNNDKLASKLRILRNHGINYENGKMDFVEAGFNYRLTDIQAALVSSQFDRFTSTLKRKSEIAKRYLTQIKNDKLILPQVPQNKFHTWQTFHMLIDDSLSQDEVLNYLRIKGIGANYGAQCIPYQTYYQKKYNLDNEKLFPNSLKAFQKGIAIPLYEKLTDEDVNYVIEIVNSI